MPLIPIVLATGWSALVVWALGIPLNPMSATLGALVIAIATEFSVLLAARYEEERARAASLGEALRRAYSRTGTAVPPPASPRSPASRPCGDATSGCSATSAWSRCSTSPSRWPA